MHQKSEICTNPRIRKLSTKHQKNPGTRALIAAHGFRAFTACTTHAPTTSVKGDKQKKTEKKSQEKEEKKKPGKRREKLTGRAVHFHDFPVRYARDCYTYTPSRVKHPARTAENRSSTKSDRLVHSNALHTTQHNTTQHDHKMPRVPLSLDVLFSFPPTTAVVQEATGSLA